MEALLFTGAPRRIRTSDIRIRSPTLYPAEPWALNVLIKFGSLSNTLMKSTQFFKKLAERAGFEPAVHLLGAYNRLAGDRFRPLSHLSVFYSADIKFF